MKRLSPALLTLALLSCGQETKDSAAPEGWRPDLFCPGDPSGICEKSAEATLEVGAAAVSIVPSCFESWIDLDGNSEYDRSSESFLDCGCDRLCEGDPGYKVADRGESDGLFQAVWMAGFQSSRPAMGLRGSDQGLRGGDDGIWARAIVLRQGDTSLAIVALDLIGWFNNLALDSKAAVQEAGLDVDHLIVHSLHPHEGPDTMGMWGPSLSVSGVDPEYVAQVHQAIVDAVSQALASAEPVAEIQAGSVDVASYHAEKGVANVISDHRDPWVIDQTLYAARFVGESDNTITTLVNFGNHPEALSDRNNLITSDFVHALRETVESGVLWESRQREGLGGTAIFINAAIGGMMTPLGVSCTDPDGNTWSESNFEKADAIGQLLGEMALDAVQEGTSYKAPQLSFRRSELYLYVENWLFQAAMNIGVFDRPTFNWDPEQDISEDNMPQVLSEVNVIEIGPIQILSVPGELLPELAVGGYDGSRISSPGQELIEADNPNPPELTLAPESPYLKDLMGGQDGQNWILGLGNDEVGYLIPSFAYELNEALPYIQEAEGDHYEETNSLGPRTTDAVLELAQTLLEWEK